MDACMECKYLCDGLLLSQEDSCKELLKLSVEEKCPELKLKTDSWSYDDDLEGCLDGIACTPPGQFVFSC